MNTYDCYQIVYINRGNVKMSHHAAILDTKHKKLYVLTFTGVVEYNEKEIIELYDGLIMDESGIVLDINKILTEN